MRKWIALALVALALMVGGCIDYDEVMVINADGSGTVSMKYVMDRSFIDGMKSMAMSMGTPEDSIESLSDMFSQAEIEKSLAGNDEGIELESFEHSETETSYVWDMKFSFKDITRLDYLSEALSTDDGEFSSDQGTQSYSKQEDGNWLFTRSFMDEGEMESQSWEDDDQEEAGDDDEDWSEEAYEEEEAEADDSDDEAEEIEMDESMGDFSSAMAGLGDHKIRFSITFPREIVESNATKIEGKTAIWEYSLMDMSLAPPELKAIIAP